MSVPHPFEYVHRELGEKTIAIGGYCVLTDEVRLQVKGREVFYLFGHAVFDTTCCGAGGVSYALVQGFVEKWKNRIGTTGHYISLIVPIWDLTLQKEIKQTIEAEKIVQQVNFVR